MTKKATSQQVPKRKTVKPADSKIMKECKNKILEKLKNRSLPENCHRIARICEKGILSDDDNRVLNQDERKSILKFAKEQLENEKETGGGLRIWRPLAKLRDDTMSEIRKIKKPEKKSPANKNEEKTTIKPNIAVGTLAEIAKIFDKEQQDKIIAAAQDAIENGLSENDVKLKYKTGEAKKVALLRKIRLNLKSLTKLLQELSSIKVHLTAEVFENCTLGEQILLPD